MTPTFLGEGLIDPQSVLFPELLAARLRPLQSDRQRQIEVLENGAYFFHKKLVAQGGRPTRPIRDEPIWKAGNEEGTIILIEPELGRETIVQANEECLMSTHWLSESSQFEKELRQWQLFREYRKSNQLLDFPIDYEMAPVALWNDLQRLNDWREFEAWHQFIFDKSVSNQEQCRKRFEGVRTLDTSQLTDTIIQDHLRDCRKRQQEISRSATHMTWIRTQYREILTESINRLDGHSDLIREFERAVWLQTDQIDRCLDRVGITFDYMSHRPSDELDDHIQRLCCLSHETSRLLKAIEDLKSFNRWRQGQLCSTLSTTAEQWQRSNEATIITFLTEYVEYRQRGLAKAKKQAESWQRNLEWQEETTKTWSPRANGVDLEDLRILTQLSSNEVVEALAKLEEVQRHLTNALPEQAAFNETRQPTQDIYPSPPQSQRASQSTTPLQGEQQPQIQTQPSCGGSQFLSQEEKDRDLEKNQIQGVREGKGSLASGNAGKPGRTNNSKPPNKKFGDLTDRRCQVLTAVVLPPPPASHDSEYMDISCKPTKLLPPKQKGRKSGRKDVGGTKAMEGISGTTKIGKPSKTKGNKKLEKRFEKLSQRQVQVSNEVLIVPPSANAQPENLDTSQGPTELLSNKQKGRKLVGKGAGGTKVKKAGREVCGITKPSKTKNNKQLKRKLGNLNESQVQALFAVAVPPSLASAGSNHVDSIPHKSEAEDVVEQPQILTPFTHGRVAQQQKMKANMSTQAMATEAPLRRSKRLRGEDADAETAEPSAKRRRRI